MSADCLVCLCGGVTERSIEDAIEDGARTLDDLQHRTNAGTGCGDCVEDLEDLLYAGLPQPR
ncbi:(2Fe-2S)-binding protein [Kitasatospora phosalacinea]|uniref:(2Fe-2S)-binding protein n=1 Tax=Kitasatospora phosalacinea TaxID=2065 RepID=UPI0035D6FB14